MTTTIEPQNKRENDTVATNKPVGYGRAIITWLLGALLIVVAYFGVRVAMGYPLIGAPQLHGFAMESPAPIGNFTLTDHNGEQVSISDYRGKIVLLYFGYTHCPDVCPATMSDLARAYDSLKQKQQDDVQIFMVTVDPERDTPELLGRYLNNFNPNFIGLTGSREEIDAAAAPLGIFYEINKVDGASAYLVDHTASVAVLDKRGYLRLVWPFGVGSEEVASDLKYFLRE